MKLTLPLACIAFITSSAFGQIPNGNFEEWIETENYEDPVGWTTSNTNQLQTVFRDEEAYEGNYAMRLSIAPYSNLTQATTTAELTTLPASIDFYARSFFDGGGALMFILFSDGIETLGVDIWHTGESMPEWTPISVPFLQNSEVTQVSISIETIWGGFTEGTGWIAIDQMAFSLPTAVGVTSDAPGMKVYPNPARGSVQVELNGLSGGTLELTDLSGKNVLRTAVGEAVQQVDISYLSPGIYLATLYDRAGQRQGTTKLLKQAQ